MDLRGGSFLIIIAVLSRERQEDCHKSGTSLVHIEVLRSQGHEARFCLRTNKCIMEKCFEGWKVLVNPLTWLICIVASCVVTE